MLFNNGFSAGERDQLAKMQKAGQNFFLDKIKTLQEPEVKPSHLVVLANVQNALDKTQGQEENQDFVRDNINNLCKLCRLRFSASDILALAKEKAEIRTWAISNINNIEDLCNIHTMEPSQIIEMMTDSELTREYLFS